MNKIRKLTIIVTSGIACACSTQSEDDASGNIDALGSGEVAFVDGERIPESLFRLHTLNSLQVEADALTPEARAEMIEQLVFLQILAAEAEKQGLTQERRIAAEIELQRQQLLARAVADRYIEENPPTESELRDLYEFNLPRLRRTEYKTRHILVDTESEAADLIAQLGDGADFAKLAMEHSTDSTQSDGGDLGWITPDSVVQPFADAIQAATPGEPVGAPVETQYGWHAILVEEIKEQAAPGLEAVRQDLTSAARSQKLDAYATGLREAAEVTTVE
jgi:peptidyl-prolyl cis-trans isomerase C